MAVTIAGNILVQSNGEALPISMGGTGQSTAPTAINALLPTQAGQSGKILVTNGTNVSWSSATMSPGGSDTMIQYNDSGTFGGNAFFTVNKSTGALTSTSTFKGIGLTISDADALNRTLRYQTLGSDRWLSFANNTTETGANSGSDFEFVRVADNGATSNIVYQVSRATGVVDFKVSPTVNGSSLSTGLTQNQVGFGSALNVLTSSTGLQYIETGTYPSLTGTLYVGDGDNGVAGAMITPRPGSIGGIGLTIQAGAGGTSAAGTLYLRGGNRAGGIGTSDSGHVVIATGTGPQTGAIYLVTGGATRFIVDQNGTWFLGASSGTSGQVLTSSGSGNPTWTTPATGVAAAGSLTGTTLASNVVSSSLTSVGTLANLTVTNPISGSVTGSSASATTATTATNIAGGGIGYIPYQSASGTTGFLNAGTSGYVLTSNGTGVAPAWAASSGGVASFNTRTGAITLTSSDVTTALTFTPYNATNPSGYTNNTGTVTSVSGTGTVSGLTLSGTVTTSGSLTLGGTLSLTSGNVTTALGYTPVNKAGDTMSGTLTMDGTHTVTGLPTPVSGSDAASKSYVDSAIAGLEWKNSAAVATTANITLSGLQTIDGYTTLAADRVLVKNQTTTSQNGIYVAASGAWSRSADANTTLLLNNATLYVVNGTLNTDTAWTQSTANPTIGSSAITFVQFGGSTAYTAGTGISIVGNSISNTGVTSAVAGTNISVSSATGAVTISVTGTVPTATTAGTVTTAAQPNITSVGTLTSLAVTGTITTNTLGNGALQVGYLTIPQRAVGTATLALTDSGQHFFNTTASQIYTIPANDVTSFPIGTAVTFVNQGAGTCTIVINAGSPTNTLYLAGAGTTGTRTLGTYGFATALKITATSWIISGTGLS